MRCNSRGCEHCFPPNAEERRALDEALEQISYISGRTPDDYLWDNDHFDRPWFAALLSAYNAGINSARDEVLRARRKYE